jgi:hypothetical protein
MILECGQWASNARRRAQPGGGLRFYRETQWLADGAIDMAVSEGPIVEAKSDGTSTIVSSPE